ncbi:MAG TPA: hypothetical protein VM536_23325, partial [Chloroflexia bacterium]|nr:hypothetical protein [Chloroflexia bacterium]
MSASPATSPPVPAPDGSAVAFLSDRKVVLLDATGGQERILAEADLSRRQRPAWSPDGKQIAYFAPDPVHFGIEIIWSVPAAGGLPTPLTTIEAKGERNGPSFERVARWSPDMRRIAVSGALGPISVVPLDVTAGNAKRVNGGEPDWSTDTRTVLYSETLNGALSLDDVVTDDIQPYRNEKRLVGTRLDEDAPQGPMPRFNADASLILYRAKGDPDPAVAVRERATGLEQLFLPGNHPAWAPDGQWIVYETGTVAPARGALGSVWQAAGLARVRADGSGQTAVLADAMWPAWGK